MLYIDSSAVVKLVIAARESDSLRSWLMARDEDLTSSVVLVAEASLAVRRMVPSVEAQRALGSVLADIGLLHVDRAVAERAARTDPPSLRALDAIHLATALSLEELSGLVTYDARLAGAARAARLEVFAPS